jgi:hypothetical protein
MRRNAESIFVVEQLHEFKFICKTVLAHESGDPGVQFNEKTEGQKSRDTVPLKKKTKGQKSRETVPLKNMIFRTGI